MFNFGIDCEFFCVSMDGWKQSVVPAYEFMNGSKSNPEQYSTADGPWAYHWDNAAVEVASPVYDGEETSLVAVFDKAHRMARRFIPGDTQLAEKATCRLSSEQLKDSRAMIFGCAPDWNAYTGKENPSPNPKEVGNLRSAGLHIHFSFKDPEADGFDANNFDHYRALAKAFDMRFGTQAAVYEYLDPLRMQLYGKSGAFRPKFEYPGIEYRVLTPKCAFASTNEHYAETLDLEWIYNNWSRFIGDAWTDEPVRSVIENGHSSVHPNVLEILSEMREFNPINMEKYANA